jgi:hypothetical protein
MTRRQALLLPLSGSVAAQVIDLARTPTDNTQIKPHPTAAPQKALVEWNPRPVFNGAPVLFKSSSFSGPGNWLGKKSNSGPMVMRFPLLPA